MQGGEYLHHSQHSVDSLVTLKRGGPSSSFLHVLVSTTFCSSVTSLEGRTAVTYSVRIERDVYGILFFLINSLRFGPVLTARNCNNPARRELSRLESSLVHEKGAWQFALTGHVANCFIANAFAIEM